MNRNINRDTFLETVAKGMRRAFPDLYPGGHLKVLGEGFSSLAVETPDGMVFRIARSTEVGEKYAREMEMLPVLKAYLPVAIPEPQVYLAGNADFPFGVIGYYTLPGTPLDPERLSPKSARTVAKQVGVILAALQRVPVDELSLRDHFDALRASWARRWQITHPALREFSGLAYAVEHDDRDEFADSIEKIRRGPILNHLGLNGWQRFG